jgi:hypothetical protein
MVRFLVSRTSRTIKHPPTALPRVKTEVELYTIIMFSAEKTLEESITILLYIVDQRYFRFLFSVFSGTGE